MPSWRYYQALHMPGRVALNYNYYYLHQENACGWECSAIMSRIINQLYDDVYMLVCAVIDVSSS